MHERLKTPDEAYRYKLGAAVTMEGTVLMILGSCVADARGERVKALFAEQLDESQDHARHVEEVFGMLGWLLEDEPSPVVDAFLAEVRATARLAEGPTRDAVLLQGVVELEHYQVGVYENLTAAALGLGHVDAAQVLQRNLDSEESALARAKRARDELGTSRR